MKVLYIHQYFKTPEDGGGLRSYYLAGSLVRSGYKVEVITAHNQAGRRTCEVDGIKVHYLPVPYDNTFGKVKRLRSFLEFVWMATLYRRQVKDVDLCYVMTTPLSTGFIALCSKWMFNTPYIFEVGDLWPEVPIQMGIIKNPILKTITRFLERYFYKHSIGLVGLSPEICDHFKKVTPGIPSVNIPNISNCDYYFPAPKAPEFMEKFGVKDELVITYAGTLGQANHLSFLISAAEACAQLPVRFMIVGEGAEKEKLIREAAAKPLENISFYDGMKAMGIRELMNITDAIYVSFLPISILASGSPNKFFDGLAAGKMIITNFDGWIGKLIRQHGLGFSYKPASPDEFRSRLLPYIEDRSLLGAAQQSARSLAERDFSLQTLGHRQETFIREVFNPHS